MRPRSNRRGTRWDTTPLGTRTAGATKNTSLCFLLSLTGSLQLPSHVLEHRLIFFLRPSCDSQLFCHVACFPPGAPSCHSGRLALLGSRTSEAAGGRARGRRQTVAYTPSRLQSAVWLALWLKVRLLLSSIVLEIFNLHVILHRRPPHLDSTSPVSMPQLVHVQPDDLVPRPTIVERCRRRS